MRTQAPIEETTPSRKREPFEAFGNYRVIGPLAKGGMAELSLAVQLGVEGFSRVVALKRVLPANAENEAFVKMFLDEARLAARLDHPQIVRIYELGVEQGRYFMAMEYLPGEDLNRIGAFAQATNLVIDADIAAVIVERAAQALHFAHEMTDAFGTPLGLVHRDVNPSNLLLTYQGNVKLVDFGIAKAATNSFQTDDGVIKGKVGYLSPEQYTPSMRVDRRCDIFGLGIVLWELLAGQRLFQRDTPASTLMALHEGTVPSLARMREGIDDELEAIAHKALARDPLDRFQTALELQEALDHYLTLRGGRPSERELAEWLTALGGTRRANLKLSIARGTHLVTSYDTLRALGAGNEPMPQLLPAPSVAPRGRPLWQVALFGAIAAAVLALGGFWITRPTAPEPGVEEVKGAVHLESEPSGALVFIGGEPTGRVTPTTLLGLSPELGVELRVEKPGYAPGQVVLVPEAGKELAHRFVLIAKQGIVQFVHVPQGGIVRVASRIAKDGDQLELPVGRARLEVLVHGRVVSTRQVEILAGPQTVDLAR